MSRLFGRARECAALDSAVAAARKGKGGSLIITGGPGAGKSELLGYVARSAGDAEIIRIEGLESESAIGLAGLHRLLLFHPNGRGVLPPAQRRALDASLGVDGSADGSYTEASPFLLGLAVLTLLGDLSGSRLLVCLIDNAHGWTQSPLRCSPSWRGGCETSASSCCSPPVRTSRRKSSSPASLTCPCRPAPG